MPDLQPADAVARVLGIEPREVAALAEQGVLNSSRGRFDVLACVRQYTEHLRGQIPRVEVDWEQARRLYEIDGATQTAIAERMQVTKQAVCNRARREGWTDRSAMVRQAREAAIRKYVERDTEAVLANVALKHELNRDLLTIIRRHVDALLKGEKPELRTSTAIRNFCLAVRTIETVDASMAEFVKPWLDEKGGAEEVELTPEKIRARLTAIREVQRAEGLQ